ncbi:MAG TPA: response regulator [Desulfobacterales bacterium]|nr:response regulator [Desulfobacterales bacterium]
MSKELDVIIVDDDPSICKMISNIIKSFYIWGEVISFTDIDEAIAYCMGCDMGVAVFVLDIYLGEKSGFDFLDQIVERFPSAREDTIIITGNASNEVVNRCISSDVTYLLEKPIRSYALQLAVRAIVMKYIKFAKRLFQNSTFAARVKTV